MGPLRLTSICLESYSPQPRALDATNSPYSHLKLRTRSLRPISIYFTDRRSIPRSWPYFSETNPAHLLPRSYSNKLMQSIALSIPVLVGLRPTFPQASFRPRTAVHRELRSRGSLRTVLQETRFCQTNPFSISLWLHRTISDAFTCTAEPAGSTIVYLLP
ncbi:hypothetical protein JAAARDRAFT_609439 [Jaapia argillacea MUCL 33604]|uniref:Uncharacterized protein n=1 Tax=Jaapia argillacea MUCL 33604 TaxID=933084 RepID=A0A067P531_9AGAM|nr:hypothetical protein JAAARDRAFT_609439 [Jaapia argillacea MUCL 33604]